MARPLKVGAVIYDPKVSVIWEIIRDFFDGEGAPIDVAFYPTYEHQNDGLLSGAIDIAWNSPLAWVDAQRRSSSGCRAIAMRDTDRDRVSYFVVRRGGPVQTLADLKGRTIATGAIDFDQQPDLHGAHRAAGAAHGRPPDVRAPSHGPADQGHAARALPPDAGDVRSGIDARVLRGERGTRKRRRRPSPRRAGGAAIGRLGVRPVRRARPDRGRVRARPDADDHVRGACLAERSSPRARVRRLVDERGGGGNR